MKFIHFNDHRKEIIQIFAKAWTDEFFKQRLLNNPEEVFKEFGIPLNNKVKLKFHFDAKQDFYINFPLKPDEENIPEDQLKMIVGGLDAATTAAVVVGPIGVCAVLAL